MIKSSLVDYPGKVACVLFTPGCNYDCFYCHNRILIDGSHDIIDPDYVKGFLEKRAGMLDGVVISGGEPTLQADLISFIRTVKGLGYLVKLDTNGSNPRVVRKLLFEGLCDYYAVDYKATAARYEEICGKGADAAAVLETIRTLLDYQADFEVRTTVIPQLSADDMLCMAAELPQVPRYVLNRYRKPEKYLACDKERIEQPLYPENKLKELADLMRGKQPHVVT